MKHVSLNRKLRLFKDERGTTITESQLFNSYAVLVADENTEAGTFEDYIINCTGKSGTLTEA